MQCNRICFSSRLLDLYLYFLTGSLLVQRAIFDILNTSPVNTLPHINSDSVEPGPVTQCVLGRVGVCSQQWTLHKWLSV